MHKTTTTLKTIKLVGMSARTNNKNEAHPDTAHIGATAQRFFQSGLLEAIAHRTNPGVLFCVYTEYENDFNGDYTFFIGEEVNAFENVSPDLQSLVIPTQLYTKFTTDSGPMPQVCVNAWQHIWQMNTKELGGKRNYIADFEVYDHRAQDPKHTILDIYIGIQE